ncbi:right-handed parallel beta-helix repeat-containing protein [Candidatus Dojkabacteria bacterium]|uniref:Probable pectate lyase C n=1 Tax=Candidatus Dojkabacteria bacterium TaxID=2099670 RepID=A0A955L1I4_9BACT|nr:right-handed parallel beta-helix repeat-containing protein [Candidatus Dojkabacteria bacterium]
MLVSDGVYRETVSMYADTSHGNLLVLKAQNPGGVTIKASDVYTNFTNVGNGIYSVPWTNNWGVSPLPAGWDTVEDQVEDIVGRREVVLINENNLDQKLRFDQLVPGSFFVDEGLDKIYIYPQVGVNINTSTVEIGTRGRVVTLSGKTNLVFNGFNLEHSAYSIIDGGGSALWVQALNNASIVNLNIKNNGGSGLGLLTLSHVFFNNIKANNNGSNGIGGSQQTQTVYNNIELKNNNWRGKRGDFTGWSQAGIKVLYVVDATFNNILTQDNYTYGLWCDTGCTNVVMNNLQSFNNERGGAYIEANHGPIEMVNSKIANNDGFGVLLANASNLMIDNSILYNNESSQIILTGDGNGRTSKNWVTNEGVLVSVYNSNFKSINNVIFAKDSANKLFDTTYNSTQLSNFLSTAEFSNNQYYHYNNENSFEKSSNIFVPFTDWVDLSNETGSKFVEPICYVNPEQNNFSLDSSCTNNQGSNNGDGSGSEIPSSGKGICGPLDSNSNGLVDLVDFTKFSGNLYNKIICTDTIEYGNCGGMDSNKDKIIDDIDFKNLIVKYKNSSACI